MVKLVTVHARRRVEQAVRRMGAARTKGDLGAVIAEEIRKFSLYELQVIGGRMNYEVDRLPSPYREKIKPYFVLQLFGMHHRLLAMHHSRTLGSMDGPVTDRETFEKFLEMVPDGCFGDQKQSGTEFYFDDPIRSLFYYLVSAFAMFILDEPGHPAGTPFPGGFTVEKRGQEYFCPIRDKEEEVPFSICNFCPAKQMDGV